MKSSPFSEGLGPAAVYFAFRLGAWLAEHMPRSFAERGMWAASGLAHRFARKKRALVRKNLARVVGEGRDLDELVRRAFESYARYWLETFRLGRYTPDEILSMIDCQTSNVVDDALARGRGVIVVTSHLGFYDLGVAWMGVRGYPFVTVAEVLRPRALFEWFARIRGERGMKVIAAKPRDEAMARLREVVAAGNGVALLSERNIGRRGVWVELFGERTTIPSGPPLLAKETAAPMISGAVYQTSRDRFRLDFREVPYDPQAGVDEIAQVIANAVEAMVRKSPDQWHLFSTNWPSDEPHLPPRGTSGESVR